MATTIIPEGSYTANKNYNWLAKGIQYEVRHEGGKVLLSGGGIKDRELEFDGPHDFLTPVDVPAQTRPFSFISRAIRDTETDIVFGAPKPTAGMAHDEPVQEFQVFRAARVEGDDWEFYTLVSQGDKIHWKEYSLFLDTTETRAWLDAHA